MSGRPSAELEGLGDGLEDVAPVGVVVARRRAGQGHREAARTHDHWSHSTSAVPTRCAKRW